MSKTRIYAVKDSDVLVALVRATSQAQAIKYVTKPFTAEVATQDQLVNLIGEGKKVQDATAEPVSEPVSEQE